MSTDLEINNTKELEEKLNEIVKDPSINKPSEEEVKQAKEEFENAAKEWSNSVYEIGKPEEAQQTCDYLKNFLMNRFVWQKEAWMGVIKLNEELSAAESTFRSNKDKSLTFGYQALEFTYYILTNPGGNGLQAALDFEAEHEIYVKILTDIGTQLENARKKLKEIEFLQQRWGAYSQGFYLEVEPELDEANEGEISEEVSGETGEPLTQ